MFKKQALLDFLTIWNMWLSLIARSRCHCCFEGELQEWLLYGLPCNCYLIDVLDFNASHEQVTAMTYQF